MFRLYSLAGALACFISVAFAYWYLQQHEGLEPCPMCILQRIEFILLGFMLLYIGLTQPVGARATRQGLMLAFLVLVGIATAGYHLYVQTGYEPPTATSLFDGGAATSPDSGCGAAGGDETTWWAMTLDAVKQTFDAKASCSKPEFFWGLSIPMWSLLAFALIALTHLPLTFARRKLQRRLFKY